MNHVATLVVFADAVAALGLAWLYFRRYEMPRLPLGVMGLADVVEMMALIILMPLLYIALPSALVLALLALANGGLVYFVAEPVLRRRWVVWLVALGVVAADVGTAWWFGTESLAFMAVNNLVIVVFVIGGANIWAQSGLKARDAAILGALLIAYDFTATWLLPTMDVLFGRLMAFPFRPMVSWQAGGVLIGLGLGDLLLAAVFPLTMRKAYGRRVGLTALAISVATLALVLWSPALGVTAKSFPVMIVLGPLLLAQYLFWSRRCGRERTTGQYLAAEPRGGAR